MRAPSAGDLLDVWEAGFAQAPAERALALLAAAYPETSRDALAGLSIGERDAGLLTLRQNLWGPQMTAEVLCPACRDRLELSLDSREMLSGARENSICPLLLNAADFRLTFRLPTSRDLMEHCGQRANGGESGQLLQRCLLSVEQGGEPVDSDKLPQEVIESVIKSMAEADPLADIQLDLTCPSCDHRWRAVFDIVSFLWTEIEAWAWRMLSDVHTLARAYGWGERDILALSPTRRQFYLEMVGA
jgi:hypothetical protein